MRCEISAMALAPATMELCLGSLSEGEGIERDLRKEDWRCQSKPLHTR